MPDLGQPNAPQPVTPDPTQGLEATAAQAPGQLGQSLQNQQQQNATPQQQPGQWSPDNPYATVAHQIKSQLDTIPVPQQSGGAIKQLLTNFLGGGGRAMMAEVGLPTPEQRRQQLQNSYLAFSQMADAHESNIADLNYKKILTDSAQQANLYQSQLQPLEIQRQHQELDAGQQALQAGAQQIPTVRPSMTAGDLAQIGVPSDLAAQYAGKPLDEADMNAVKQMAAANQKQVYDYGQDGHGQGRGVWLVDKQMNPIKQLSPISETSRSTSIARQQMQMQLAQAQSGSMGADVVEGHLDPSQISPRSPNYPYVLNAANQYSQQKYGTPFDFAKAAGDFKYANNPSTKNTLNYLTSLTGPDGQSGNLGELVKQSDSISRTRFPALNDVAAWARLQAGDPAIAGMHATITEVSDQVAKILQGGSGGSGTSDAKLKQAQDLFNTGFSKAQIRSVATTLQPLLQNCKQGIIGNNSYLQRWYGTKGAAAAGAASLTQPTATAGFNWNNYPVVNASQSAPAAGQP